jgi:sporulation protein YlmC with PRC-barrel domain
MRCKTIWRLASISVLACIPLGASFAQFGRDGQAIPDYRQTEKKAPEVAPGPPAIPGTTTDWRAGKLIGTTMTNILGASIGKVEDVVIDKDGKVVAVMVSVGGFLGIGESPVAIGMRHLVITQLEPDHLEVKTSLSREAIEQAATVDLQEEPPVTP